MDLIESIGFLLFVFGVVCFAFYQLIIVNQTTDNEIKKVNTNISDLYVKIRALNQMIIDLNNRVTFVRSRLSQFDTTKEAAEEDMCSGRNV